MNRTEYEHILSNAIESEKEAQAFYGEVAKKMTDPGLQELFQKFVEEENRHQRILEGFREKAPEHLPFDETRDYKVAETVDEVPLSTDMKPADAFALAMKKEEAAMKHYAELAEGCTDPDQAGLFRELAAMERDHKRKMEKAFVETGFPEAW
ncbi:MAG: ferritin-like domain-containing protein [Desulfococcaceae bacterium]